MPLKSVDDHNQGMRRQREEVNRQMLLTGVACPKCGNELMWESSYAIASIDAIYPHPTTRRARCSPCTLTVNLEI